jgi:hypothetical protein
MATAAKNVSPTTITVTTMAIARKALSIMATFPSPKTVRRRVCPEASLDRRII